MEPLQMKILAQDFGTDLFLLVKNWFCRWATFASIDVYRKSAGVTIYG
jgi:hypothetical protein